MQKTLQEREKVDLFLFRLERFVALGFAKDEAEMLALSDVDWHRAENLIDRGCPPAVALQILI